MRGLIVVLGLVGLAAPGWAQEADADGAALFRRQCGTCHSLRAGENRQGPSLAGVYGRKAGSVPGFRYSAGLSEADWAWDEARLDPYLANPQAAVKGTTMGYRQSKPEVRQEIIAFLKAQAP